MSLRALVERNSPDALFLYNAELSLGNPNIDFIANFRNSPKPSVVMGHFSYSVHRMLGVAPCYVTVLREPIARVVSLYRYWRANPDPAVAAYFKAGISLHDFVTKEITEQTNNHMCRMIAGIPPEAGLSLNEQWLLELAIHNLKRHYALVGTQERLPEFIVALGRQLNWGAVDVPRINESTGDPVKLDDRTRKVIADRNALDIKLYEYVTSSHHSV
jgi:hypothetical protein